MIQKKKVKGVSDMEVLERKNEKRLKMDKSHIAKIFLTFAFFGVLIGGLFYPKIGLFAFVCMIGSVLLSFYKGRYWCYRFCPRGAFLDEFIARASFNKSIPAVLKSRFAKAFMLTFFIVMMSANAILSGGDLERFGKGVVMLLWVTTLVSAILGILFRARTWCVICPMGTVSGVVGKKRGTLKIHTQKCISCKLCNKNCPMEVEVCNFKENGNIESVNCIKCESCKVACPKNAIEMA
jgi:polyferredoxin